MTWTPSRVVTGLLGIVFAVGGAVLFRSFGLPPSYAVVGGLSLAMPLAILTGTTGAFDRDDYFENRPRDELLRDYLVVAVLTAVGGLVGLLLFAPLVPGDFGVVVAVGVGAIWGYVGFYVRNKQFFSPPGS